MVDNQHKKIAGYRDLSETEIAAMNALKDQERSLLVQLDQITDNENGRHVSLAKTHIETGFMFAIKAIAKPEPYYTQPGDLECGEPDDSDAVYDTE